VAAWDAYLREHPEYVPGVADVLRAVATDAPDDDTLTLAVAAAAAARGVRHAIVVDGTTAAISLRARKFTAAKLAALLEHGIIAVSSPDAAYALLMSDGRDLSLGALHQLALVIDATARRAARVVTAAPPAESEVGGGGMVSVSSAALSDRDAADLAAAARTAAVLQFVGDAKYSFSRDRAALLVEALGPAAVSRADSFGLLPLHWAAVSGNLDVVDVLLAAGADPNAGTEARGRPRPEAYLPGAPIVSLLCNRKAAPETKLLLVRRLFAAGQDPAILAAPPTFPPTILTRFALASQPPTLAAAFLATLRTEDLQRGPAAAATAAVTATAAAVPAGARGTAAAAAAAAAAPAPLPPAAAGPPPTGADRDACQRAWHHALFAAARAGMGDARWARRREAVIRHATGAHYAFPAAAEPLPPATGGGGGAAAVAAEVGAA